MKRLTIEVGGFGVNCSLMMSEGRAIVIDPGQEAERIAELMKLQGVEPEAILLTHAHFDHIGGVPGLLKRYPGLPVYVTAADSKVISHPFNQYPPEYPAISIANTAEPYEFAKSAGFEVIDTPGHTPGGVSFYFPEEKTLFSGDTLFAGSYGRTDLPGGDFDLLMASLSKLLSRLPDGTMVIPGHGSFTTIGDEKR